MYMLPHASGTLRLTALELQVISPIKRSSCADDGKMFKALCDDGGDDATVA